MTSSISSMLNSKLRLSGLSSGLDTDSMVQQLMKAELAKLDKVKQQKQIMSWKQEDYRDMTNLLRSMKDEYMDVIKPTSNMLSQSNYKIYKAESTSTSITATANSTAVAGTKTITVTQMAKAAQTSSADTVTSDLVSSISDYNFSSAKDFNINLGGVTKNISIAAGDYSGNVDTLVSNLQASIDTAFGTTSTGASKITVQKVLVDSVEQIKFTSSDSRMTLTSGTVDVLSQLGITSGSTNRLDLSSTLDKLNLKASVSGTLAFTINGTNFSFDTTTKTMNDVIGEINSSSANVTLSYSEVSDKFTLTSKATGAGEAIKVTDSLNGLFNAIDINNSGSTEFSVSNGQDAEFTLSDIAGAISRSSNSFIIDGVAYNVKDVGAATITITQDVNSVYDKIKSFVDKYNDMISKINTELTEKVESDYAPLTDDQRSAMSDENIKAWETKAKSGMLKNDSILSNAINNMRRAIFDPIDGVSGNLSEIGITTSTYLDKGKLIIDEDKLKAAITNTPDKVANLFAKNSEIEYSPNLTAEQREERYNNSGIVNRLSDILQDNIRTTRDNNGKKGLLLEKAGITGDISEFKNMISDELSKTDTTISDMLVKLQDKEDSYYAKFSAMETALSKMNSQSAWLSQQFGTSSQ